MTTARLLLDRRAAGYAARLARPGPPRPRPDAIRLVYVDREPADELVAAIEAHALAD